MDLEGRHAVLSASSSAWVNYDDEKMQRVYWSRKAAQRGTDLHALAQFLIRMEVKLPEEPPTTMSMYVNDCIGYKMETEVPLFVSVNAFGTPDAIQFRKKVLRVFDLKTGTFQASVRQLEVYAAYFCMEYFVDPLDKDQVEEIDLRIYQNNDVKRFIGDPEVIAKIIETTKRHDRNIAKWKEENE